ncbi:hypothetical protein DXG01_008401, partial [Tephrocybe rancida]
VIKYDKSMTSEEWVGIISAAYHERLNELGDMKDNMAAKCAHFKEYLDWYAQNLNTYVDKLRQDSNFRALLGQILDPFVKMSVQAYKQYIFGYAIDIECDAHGATASVAWGGSLEYIESKAEFLMVMNHHIGDFEGMLRTKSLKKRFQSDSKDRFAVDLHANGKTRRDYYHRVMGGFCQADIGLHIGHTLTDAQATALTMLWKAFPKFAVKNRLRAIGWRPDIAPPGPKLNFKELSTKILQEMVEVRIAAMNSPDEDHNIIQIVPWTKEEKRFDVKDQAMVPLVIDSNNNALVVVQDSKNYKQSLGK